MNELREAYICDAVRTPIGRFGGALAYTRADDLAAMPLAALRTRNSDADWEALDEVMLGCANQAGEDNRNVARMAAAARRIAGTRAGRDGEPFVRLRAGSGRRNRARDSRRRSRICDCRRGRVHDAARRWYMAKAEKPFQRSAEIFDTTIGWRFVNPLLQAQYGTDSMPETAENVAEQFQITREDQDAFALRSQQRTAVAIENGYFAEEIIRVHGRDANGKPVTIERDEHPSARQPRSRTWPS